MKRLEKRQLRHVMREWDAAIKKADEAEQVFKDARREAAVLMNEYNSLKAKDETT